MITNVASIYTRQQNFVTSQTLQKKDFQVEFSYLQKCLESWDALTVCLLLWAVVSICQITIGLLVRCSVCETVALCRLWLQSSFSEV